MSDRRWVLLVMDDPQFGGLYTRLLERRGYRVQTTHCLQEAQRLLQSDHIDLAVIDADLEDPELSARLDHWFDGGSHPALILLYTPETMEDQKEATFPLPRRDADLILQKPLSPMEFGIQVDQLLQTSDHGSTLEETSAVEREFDAIQREFSLQLQEDIDRIHHRWRELVDTSRAPTEEARKLLHIAARTRKAARHFGFSPLADHLQALATFLVPLTTTDGVLHEDDVEKGLAILSELRESCQTHITAHPDIVLRCESDDRGHTVLIIEGEADFTDAVLRHCAIPHTTIHHTSNANSIIESLEKYRPELLMLDAHLPKVSCFDICRTVRSISRWQPLPIVILSKQDTPETRRAAFQSGADDVISHGIDPEELGARLARRLESARLHRERADRDLLTGLLNRRAFLEQLSARLSEAHRHQRPLAFCLLDVDHFKQVNDRYGHPTGDRVLKAVGELLQERFRIEDLRARWGGEEFAVVLVDDDAAAARQALDRVRREFSNIPFCADDGRTFYVTFSAGIAEFGADGTDADGLLTAADTRLLRAKRAGRDTILTGRS